MNPKLRELDTTTVLELMEQVGDRGGTAIPSPARRRGLAEDPRRLRDRGRIARLKWSSLAPCTSWRRTR